MTRHPTEIRQIFGPEESMFGKSCEPTESQCSLCPHQVKQNGTHRTFKPAWAATSCEPTRRPFDLAPVLQVTARCCVKHIEIMRESTLVSPGYNSLTSTVSWLLSADAELATHFAIFWPRWKEHELLLFSDPEGVSYLYCTWFHVIVWSHNSP